MVEELVGRAGFHDLAVGHKDDAIGHAAGKVHLVRNDDHRHALLGQTDHDLEHLVDHFGIKSARGLVKEHGLGLHGKRAGDGYALLLAARKLCGHLVGLLGHAHATQQVHGALTSFLLGHAQHVDRPQHDVLQHRHMCEQVELLKHHAQLGAHAGKVFAFLRQGLALDENLARVDGFQAVDGSAHGRLARARRTDHNDDLAAVDREIDVVEDV